MTQNDRIEAAASAYRNNMNRLVAEAAGCEATFDAAIRLAFREGARFALENQWMSVEERLPKNGRLVIVRLNYIGEGITYDMAYYQERWCSMQINWGDDKCAVTHWMEIPKLSEKPKDEKDINKNG